MIHTWQKLQSMTRCQTPKWSPGSNVLIMDTSEKLCLLICLPWVPFVLCAVAFAVLDRVFLFHEQQLSADPVPDWLPLLDVFSAYYQPYQSDEIGIEV